MHTEAHLDAVADELNDRPRKRLQFEKPIDKIGPQLLRDRQKAAEPHAGERTAVGDCAAVMTASGLPCDDDLAWRTAGR